MLMIEIQYRDVDLGLTSMTTAYEARPSDRARKIVQTTVDAWIRGDIEPFRTVDIGHEIATKRRAVRSIGIPDPESRVIRYTSSVTPLTVEHVLAAKYHTRTENGESHDPVTGAEVVPWVHITCEDGSQADVLAVIPASILERAPEPEPEVAVSRGRKRKE